MYEVNTVFFTWENWNKAQLDFISWLVTIQTADHSRKKTYACFLNVIEWAIIILISIQGEDV